MINCILLNNDQLLTFRVEQWSIINNISLDIMFNANWQFDQIVPCLNHNSGIDNCSKLDLDCNDMVIIDCQSEMFFVLQEEFCFQSWVGTQIASASIDTIHQLFDMAQTNNNKAYHIHGNDHGNDFKNQISYKQDQIAIMEYPVNNLQDIVLWSKNHQGLDNRLYFQSQHQTIDCLNDEVSIIDYYCDLIEHGIHHTFIYSFLKNKANQIIEDNNSGLIPNSSIKETQEYFFNQLNQNKRVSERKILAHQNQNAKKSNSKSHL